MCNYKGDGEYKVTLRSTFFAATAITTGVVIAGIALGPAGSAAAAGKIAAGGMTGLGEAITHGGELALNALS